MEKSHERKGLVNDIWCVQRCKSLKDCEFCEEFSRYYGHPRVLLFCVFHSRRNTLILQSCTLCF